MITVCSLLTFKTPVRGVENRGQSIEVSTPPEESCKVIMNYVICVARKHGFGVSDQVQHKHDCTATEDNQILEISDLKSRGIVLSL